MIARTPWVSINPQAKRILDILDKAITDRDYEQELAQIDSIISALESECDNEDTEKVCLEEELAKLKSVLSALFVFACERGLQTEIEHTNLYVRALSALEEK